MREVRSIQNEGTKNDQQKTANGSVPVAAILWLDDNEDLRHVAKVVRVDWIERFA
jgi:hypothetical protein